MLAPRIIQSVVCVFHTLEFRTLEYAMAIVSVKSTDIIQPGTSVRKVCLKFQTNDKKTQVTNELGSGSVLCSFRRFLNLSAAV